MTRLRRIWEKARLRIRFAAWMLLHYEDTLARSVCRVSFAQNGEDLMVWSLFQRLGITRPTYLDIGAHHPYRLSNTALLHYLGSRGMNIEADPQLHAAFVKHRPRDINLNIGIAAEAGTMTFFRMEDRSLNTFSSEEAQRLSREYHMPIREEIAVPVMAIRQLLDEQRFRPDFLSIDVEGKDLEILRTYDFKRHRPAVICAETISFLDQLKNQELISYLLGQGYQVYADSQINTIFVDSALPLK
jgi:FkbM family methyltransferase